MMKRSSIERALVSYANYHDPEVPFRLSLLGPALLASAGAARQLAEQDCQWRPERLNASLDGQPLLRLGRWKVTQDEFDATVAPIAKALAESFKLTDEEVNQINWEAFRNERLLELLATDPVRYLETVYSLDRNADLMDLWVMPTLGFAVRALLNQVAQDVSKALAKMDDPIASKNRTLTCPTCGAGAELAIVGPTALNGQVKELHCSCCGTHWHFERIRCAHCGEMAVSDLSYVQDERSPEHRLHLCKSCGAATPTYFAKGDAMTYNPEVESIVLTSLERAYFASQQLEKEDQDA